MKQSTAVGLWAGLVVISVLEVVLMKSNPGKTSVDLAIGILASVAAATTAMFSMDLREENTAVKYLFLIPVLLVAVLIITLLLAFPVIQ